MKISGFSFARNAEKLYFPVGEAIKSILPVCDEFVVAVGKGDDDDRTREIVEAIGDPKIRIIDTDWTDRERLKGRIHSAQTNIALRECTGDWCFYVQADEVVHENDLPKIRRRCEDLLDDKEVEGLLFRYRHFWGDYDHFHISHRWYPEEIRIIRNGMGIESWETAQSFRRKGNKLKVAGVDAYIYHYGWVRPPCLMQAKSKEMSTTHWGKARADAFYADQEPEFDYGLLSRLAVYRGTHPSVMKDRISRMDWKDKLQYSGRPRVKHKHDRLKYRILTFIEQKLAGGRQLGGFKNYVRLKNR
ncbi:MAG: glycosyltransferase [Chitinivibrionales bacterium]|nr:glycosyltransferase [Chitinivibrionales bacterium]